MWQLRLYELLTGQCLGANSWVPVGRSKDSMLGVQVALWLFKQGDFMHGLMLDDGSIYPDPRRLAALSLSGVAIKLPS